MTMTMRFEPVIEALPPAFDDLRLEATAEGYRFIERLATDWQAGTMRFIGEGEKLLCAFVDNIPAGLGGLTLDPDLPGAMRMRRFYVRRPFRQRGIGRRLVDHLLESPRRMNKIIVVHAGDGSAGFWEALGFTPDPYDGHSHILHPPTMIDRSAER